MRRACVRKRFASPASPLPIYRSPMTWRLLALPPRGFGEPQGFLRRQPGALPLEEAEALPEPQSEPQSEPQP